MLRRGRPARNGAEQLLQERDEPMVASGEFTVARRAERRKRQVICSGRRLTSEKSGGRSRHGWRCRVSKLESLSGLAADYLPAAMFDRRAMHVQMSDRACSALRKGERVLRVSNAYIIVYPCMQQSTVEGRW